MRILQVSKDGGPESTVWAYWLFEIKWLGSIVLLKFEDGSRAAYHSHAFNSVSWLLSGELVEFHDADTIQDFFDQVEWHSPSWLFPILTFRTTKHKVVSKGRSWVLSFRGPWAKTWVERTPDGKETVLTHGRKPVELQSGFTLGAPICPGVVSEEFKEKLRQFGASPDA